MEEDWSAIMASQGEIVRKAAPIVRELLEGVDFNLADAYRLDELVGKGSGDLDTIVHRLERVKQSPELSHEASELQRLWWDLSKEVRDRIEFLENVDDPSHHQRPGSVAI